MWDTIIGGSVVAGITGLAIVAVKEPAIYKRLHTTLAVSSLLLFVLYFGTNYGGMLSSIDSLERTYNSSPESPINSLDFEITNLTTKSNHLKTVWWIFFGFNLYISALSGLKYIFRKPSDLDESDTGETR